MKILAFLSLFIISSCNVYELVGQKTSVSDEFKSILPKIVLDTSYIQLSASDNGFSHNAIRLKILGGEKFIGSNGEDLKASGDIFYDTLSFPLIGLDSSMTITKEDDYTVKIEFNTPSPALNTSTVASEEIVNLHISNSSFTNDTGIPVSGLNHTFAFGP
jgi:ABC-type transport system substrate-binding protein